MKNVVKMGFVVASVVAASFAVAADAVATKMAAGKPDLTIRGGLFLPSDATAMAVSKSWVAFGVDLRLSSFAVNSARTNGYYSVSVDYASRAGWRSIPVTFNYNVVDGALTYFGGIGLGLTRNPTDAEKYVALATAGASIMISPRVSLSGKYTVVTRKAYSGFGVFIGVKI